MTYVVAAGNEHEDASQLIPAAYDEVITVSALADSDGRPGGARRIARLPGRRGRHPGQLLQLRPGVDIDRPRRVHLLHYAEDGSVSATAAATAPYGDVVRRPARGRRRRPVDQPAPRRASPAEVRNAIVAAGSFDWDNRDDPDGLKEPLVDVSSSDPRSLFDRPVKLFLAWRWVKRKLTQRGRERRQQILDESSPAFAERGYHPTSVAEIVTALGVGKGVFYWYFASKEELFLEILGASTTCAAAAAGHRRRARPAAPHRARHPGVAAVVRENRHLSTSSSSPPPRSASPPALRRGEEVAIADVDPPPQGGIVDGRIPDSDPTMLAHALLGVDRTWPARSCIDDDGPSTGGRRSPSLLPRRPDRRRATGRSAELGQGPAHAARRPGRCAARSRRGRSARSPRRRGRSRRRATPRPWPP